MRVDRLTGSIYRACNRHAIKNDNFNRYDAAMTLGRMGYMEVPLITELSTKTVFAAEKFAHKFSHFKVLPGFSRLYMNQAILLYNRVKFMSRDTGLNSGNDKWRQILRNPPVLVIGINAASKHYSDDWAYFLNGLIYDPQNYRSEVANNPTQPMYYYFHPLTSYMATRTQHFYQYLEYIAAETNRDTSTVLRLIQAMPTFITKINMNHADVGVTALRRVPFNLDVDKLKIPVFPPVLKREHYYAAFKAKKQYPYEIMNNYNGMNREFVTKMTNLHHFEDVKYGEEHEQFYKKPLPGVRSFRDLLDTNYVKYPGHEKLLRPSQLYKDLEFYKSFILGPFHAYRFRRFRLRSMRLERRATRDEILIRLKNFHIQADKTVNYLIENRPVLYD